MLETSTEEPQIITKYETMMYKRRDNIAYIMLNRPQALNAVNDQFEEDLHSALLEFDLDDEAWVAIVHGAGRSFCAGADIKQRLVAMTPEQSARRERGPNPEGYMGRAINWKPIIAAVHGYALGAGIVIAAESDMIVASFFNKSATTET
nr:enoyl-CoA hydratase/isomerase family protein [Dehalococcoidia bacterium]